MLAPVGRVQAGNTEEARAYVEKATAAFALTHYAAAAENFEKAFELRPDPALLYNAAQSHRLAGNKERALALYRNYLRIYAKRDKRAEIEARIEELEKAVARDKAIENAPPTTTEPIAAGPGEAMPEADRAAPPPPAAAPPPSSAPTLVAQPAAPESSRPLTTKPWFWATVAAGVAAAVVVVVLVSSSGAKDPSPSIGRVNGN
jgi:hypothetical protein